MATDSERLALWNSMLEADYCKRYWHAKAASFVKFDRLSQIVLAVLSSSAVLSALGDMKLMDIWKYLSAATAVLATALPFMSYTRRSVTMTEVGSKWHVLEIEYESMWREIDRSDFSEQKFKELKAREIELGKLASELPADDKRLQKNCYDQILITRGAINK